MNKTRWGIVVLSLALAALCLSYAGYLFWLGVLYPYPPNPTLRDTYLLHTAVFLVASIALVIPPAVILIRAYRETRKHGKSGGMGAP